ncbi:hypothetical protein GCM10023185_02130 [Hymenobacter saemangeumensis]|uniref:GWxTD domain-containing protein n=1 Tax=Hymenobacter saemangeumensis TaxID=1084522 RepID=A0ABP8HY09_9BACT
MRRCQWKNLVRASCLLLALGSCRPEPESAAAARKRQLPGHWLLYFTARQDEQGRTQARYFRDEPGYNANRQAPQAIAFTADSIEFLNGIFSEGPPDSVYKHSRPRIYRGNFARYRLRGDSILWEHPADKCWQLLGRVQRLRNDTLLLAPPVVPEEMPPRTVALREGYRRLPPAARRPTYDEIAFSVHGWTSFSIVLVTREGQVLFQENRGQPGIRVGQLTPYQRELLFSKFEQIDTATAARRAGGGIDGDVAATCLIRDHKIVASFRDWGMMLREMNGAKELQWAYVPAYFLPRTLHYPPPPPLTPPFNSSLLFDYFVLGHDELPLERAESLFLWHELQQSRPTTAAIALHDTLRFWHFRGPAPQAEGATAEAFRPVAILTDGRYYRFCFANKTTTTLDLGYNFIARNGLAQRRRPKSY